MSSDQIVLFDIPSKDRSCWSLNPWKITMDRIMALIAPIYLPRVPRNILSSHSIPYWMRTREARMPEGMDMAEYERAYPAEKALDKVEGW
ncbi:hypothetical protein N0V88_007514 [Collariella sp. IMI 366227]|nr:hypothetical protein N0V88_007514 [Collariella sp. IMI 366227]